MYEPENFGHSHFNFFSKDQEPILSCFTKKRNLAQFFYAAEKQSTNFQQFRTVFTNGKKLSVADMLGGSLTQKEIQLKQ